jgi:hypothetical protein
MALNYQIEAKTKRKKQKGRNKKEETKRKKQRGKNKKEEIKRKE